MIGMWLKKTFGTPRILIVNADLVDVAKMQQQLDGLAIVVPVQCGQGKPPEYSVSWLPK